MGDALRKAMRIELTAKLTAWQTAMQDCEQQMDGLADLIGTSPESPLQAAVYRLMGAHTQATADAIGWDADTLVAWWTEHNFGERPMQIGLPGEPMRTIDCIEALALCIADDLERAA